jgi:TonB family protein
MDAFHYLLKINAATVILYCIYRLLSRQDTFFRWRRAALIAILLTAILYPFVDLSQSFANSQYWAKLIRDSAIPFGILPEITVFGQATGTQTPSSYTLPQALAAIYGLVVAGFLLRVLIQLASIGHIIRTSQIIERDKQTIVLRNPKIDMPFSFLRWIVFNSDRYTDVERNEILRHEKTHARQGHSIDIILAELFCACCWFNPFAWLLKHEIRMNLEFLADRSVLASGYEAKHYQFHLLRLTYRKAALKITNNFNVSLLKKRIFMMNKKQTSNRSVFKYAFLIPAIAALVFGNSLITAQAETTVDPPPAPVSAKAPKIVTSKEEIYSHVEQMPDFPGGQKALIQWLSNNIHYPKEAVEKQISGRVIVRFIIREDGTVGGGEIIRSDNEIFNKEALRVVSIMPKWTPGRQSGKAVSVYYTLPIQFSLTGSNEAEKESHLDDPLKGEMKELAVRLPDNASESDPTYLIDGKPATKEDLKNLHPDNIKSVDVLKEPKPGKIEITLKK